MKRPKLKQLFPSLLIGLLFTSASFAVEVSFKNSNPANPKLPFSEAVKVGDLLYMSGQIGWDADNKRLAPGGLVGQTHQTLKNIQQTLQLHGGDKAKIVKCMVMLTDISDFAEFNKIYTQYFTPPYPTRSAFAVKELALGAVVEVECTAVFTD